METDLLHSVSRNSRKRNAFCMQVISPFKLSQQADPSTDVEYDSEAYDELYRQKLTEHAVPLVVEFILQLVPDIRDRISSCLPEIIQRAQQRLNDIVPPAYQSPPLTIPERSAIEHSGSAAPPNGEISADTIQNTTISRNIGHGQSQNTADTASANLNSQSQPTIMSPIRPLFHLQREVSSDPPTIHFPFHPTTLPNDGLRPFQPLGTSLYVDHSQLQNHISPQNLGSAQLQGLTMPPTPDPPNPQIVIAPESSSFFQWPHQTTSLNGNHFQHLCSYCRNSGIACQYCNRTPVLYPQ
jgi:hypothetical protein